jgi:hypothetical protein
MGRRVDIPWAEGVDIPWVGVDIPDIGGSIYHG